jgi:hypothetical protein
MYGAVLVAIDGQDDRVVDAVEQRGGGLEIELVDGELIILLLLDDDLRRDGGGGETANAATARERERVEMRPSGKHGGSGV